MDSLELDKICKHPSFLGVFPCDALPTFVPYPSCLIANTKPKNDVGEHWIAIFINKEGYGDYFCSYGLSPRHEFVLFLNKHSNSWNFNRKRIQGDLSTTCGQYCAFFIFCRTRGLPMHKFLSLFTRDYDENDAIVTSFINGKFNVDTKITVLF